MDVRGLACPIPVFEVNKAITQVKPGETLEVLATDPAAVGDIKSWAERRGHVFVGAEKKDGYTRITVMRRA